MIFYSCACPLGATVLYDQKLYFLSIYRFYVNLKQLSINQC